MAAAEVQPLDEVQQLDDAQFGPDFKATSADADAQAAGEDEEGDGDGASEIELPAPVPVAAKFGVLDMSDSDLSRLSDDDGGSGGNSGGPQEDEYGSGIDGEDEEARMARVEEERKARLRAGSPRGEGVDAVGADDIEARMNKEEMERREKNEPLVVQQPQETAAERVARRAKPVLSALANRIAQRKKACKITTNDLIRRRGGLSVAQRVKMEAEAPLRAVKRPACAMIDLEGGAFDLPEGKTMFELLAQPSKKEAEAEAASGAGDAPDAQADADAEMPADTASGADQEVGVGNEGSAPTAASTSNEPAVNPFTLAVAPPKDDGSEGDDERDDEDEDGEMVVDASGAIEPSGVADADMGDDDERAVPTQPMDALQPSDMGADGGAGAVDATGMEAGANSGHSAAESGTAEQGGERDEDGNASDDKSGSSESEASEAPQKPKGPRNAQYLKMLQDDAARAKRRAASKGAALVQEEAEEEVEEDATAGMGDFGLGKATDSAVQMDIFGNKVVGAEDEDDKDKEEHDDLEIRAEDLEAVVDDLSDHEEQGDIAKHHAELAEAADDEELVQVVKNVEKGWGKRAKRRRIGGLDYGDAKWGDDSDIEGEDEEERLARQEMERAQRRADEESDVSSVDSFVASDAEQAETGKAAKAAAEAVESEDSEDEGQAIRERNRKRRALKTLSLDVDDHVEGSLLDEEQGLLGRIKRMNSTVFSNTGRSPMPGAETPRTTPTPVFGVGTLLPGDLAASRGPTPLARANSFIGHSSMSRSASLLPGGASTVSHGGRAQVSGGTRAMYTAGASRDGLAGGASNSNMGGLPRSNSRAPDVPRLSRQQSAPARGAGGMARSQSLFMAVMNEASMTKRQ